MFHRGNCSLYSIEGSVPSKGQSNFYCYWNFKIKTYTSTLDISIPAFLQHCLVRGISIIFILHSAQYFALSLSLNHCSMFFFIASKLFQTSLNPFCLSQSSPQNELISHQSTLYSYEIFQIYSHSIPSTFQQMNILQPPLFESKQPL